MNTATTTLPRQREPGETGEPRRVWPRIVLGILAVLTLGILLAAFGALAWVKHAMRVSLPQLDGEISVAGLSAPVRVRRDGHGVPHIEAATLKDLIFAQGYVTAQDRLWQMDVDRRYAAGEMAEILGKSMLPHDRQMRILETRRAADAAVAGLPLGDREMLEAYARGVNAFIADAKGHLPAEFRVLRYEPKPWEPVDSVLIAVNIITDLESMYPTKMVREKIAAHLSPELQADLYPVGSWRDHPPEQSEPDLTAPQHDIPDVPLDESQSWLHIWPKIPGVGDVGRWLGQRGVWGGEVLMDDRCAECTPGSNNWVVAGAHTASGRPLLSNDMHLGHTIPAVWYEAQLHAGEFDVAGVTLPGLPFVVVGHNRRIAWGYTNTYSDVQDLYIEKTNAADQYQGVDGKWRPIEHSTERIHVRGGEDVNLQVSRTAHGPVITDILPNEQRVIALKWTLYDPQALGMPLQGMNAATDWESFRAALHQFNPHQNVVYADVDGNVGFQAAGKVPLRPGGLVSVPVNVAEGDTAHEWSGYIPFEGMPSVYNPASGMVATANSRVTPDNTAYPLTLDWAAPYRNERIWKVLGAADKLTPQDMLRLQTDVYSELDHELAQRFAYAIDHSGKANAQLRRAADLMRTWDGRVSVDSVAANIVFAARKALWPLILAPKLGQELGAAYTWGEQSFVEEELVMHSPPRWLSPGYANWDELMAAAVAKRLKDAGAPGDLSRWTYGKTHTVEVRHPLYGMIPGLRGWTGTGALPQSGDTTTVKQVGHVFGPSERMTVDFSNLDGSTLIITMGESGNPLSPYYRDQWKAWYGGTTFAFPFSDSAVQAATAHTLMLEPR